MKSKEEKNKKYWLIPAISFGIAILLQIIRMILIKLYPCDYNMPNLGFCHSPIKYHKLFTIAHTIKSISLYIGTISLPFVIHYYKYRKATRKKYWIIPIICVLVSIINLMIGIELTDYSQSEGCWSTSFGGGCYTKKPFDLRGEDSGILSIISMIEAIVIIPTVITLSNMQNKEEKNKSETNQKN